MWVTPEYGTWAEAFMADDDGYFYAEESAL